jgi:putative methyltransferase (TIGR04325 family)
MSIREIFRRLARQWLPAALQELVRPLYGRSVYYRGIFTGWSQTAARSAGYDDTTILDRVKEASLKVKSGAAPAERDGFVLPQTEHSWPVLACCLRAATERENSLCVLDFGGSLGSSYFHCRDFLSTVRIESWSVVEQTHFAQCGREHFEDATLHFFDSIADYSLKGPPDVALLSGVLQYLSDPTEAMRQILGCEPRYIVLDRTPIWEGASHWLTIQYVPPRFYRASYPCWIFSANFLREQIGASYEMIAEFPGSDGRATASGREFRFVGMILRRK